MEAITKGVWLLSGFPRYAINVYLAEDVLIDAATRWARARIWRQLKGKSLSLVALTHCHPDHQGAARDLCLAYRVPLACHEADVAVMEGRAPMGPANWLMSLGSRFWAGPPWYVDRVLHHGDLVAGFRVIHAPGHTPGHIIYFRESDRVAIAGDVLVNVNFLTGQARLGEPPAIFSANPAQNRRSIRMLADLRPSILCFGHGPPLSQPEVLERLAARLAVEAAASARVQ